MPPSNLNAQPAAHFTPTTVLIRIFPQAKVCPTPGLHTGVLPSASALYPRQEATENTAPHSHPSEVWQRPIKVQAHSTAILSSPGNQTPICIFCTSVFVSSASLHIPEAGHHDSSIHPFSGPCPVPGLTSGALYKELVLDQVLSIKILLVARCYHSQALRKQVFIVSHQLHQGL